MHELNLNITSDAELIKKAQIKLNKMSTDLNTVISNLIQKIVDDDTEHNHELKKKNDYNLLSFEDLTNEEREKRIKMINTKGPRVEAKGIFKGMIWMAEDFNEPLECMKEYME